MGITTNKSIRDWTELLAGDEVLATAILDRLLHHSHVVTIRGESYELRKKRRSGLLQRVAPAQDNTNVHPRMEGVSSS